MEEVFCMRRCCDQSVQSGAVPVGMELMQRGREEAKGTVHDAPGKGFVHGRQRAEIELRVSGLVDHGVEGQRRQSEKEVEGRLLVGGVAALAGFEPAQYVGTQTAVESLGLGRQRRFCRLGLVQKPAGLQMLFNRQRGFQQGAGGRQQPQVEGRQQSVAAQMGRQLVAALLLQVLSGLFPGQRQDLQLQGAVKNAADAAQAHGPAGQRVVGGLGREDDPHPQSGIMGQRIQIVTQRLDAVLGADLVQSVQNQYAVLRQLTVGQRFLQIQLALGKRLSRQSVRGVGTAQGDHGGFRSLAVQGCVEMAQHGGLAGTGDGGVACAVQQQQLGVGVRIQNPFQRRFAALGFVGALLSVAGGTDHGDGGQQPQIHFVAAENAAVYHRGAGRRHRLQLQPLPNGGVFFREQLFIQQRSDGQNAQPPHGQLLPLRLVRDRHLRHGVPGVGQLKIDLFDKANVLCLQVQLLFVMEPPQILPDPLQHLQGIGLISSGFLLNELGLKLVLAAGIAEAVLVLVAAVLQVGVHIFALVVAGVVQRRIVKEGAQQRTGDRLGVNVQHRPQLSHVGVCQYIVQAP